jgi:hypothetical protein
MKPPKYKNATAAAIIAITRFFFFLSNLSQGKGEEEILFNYVLSLENQKW